MKKRIYTKEPEGKWLCVYELRTDKNGIHWLWELTYLYEVKDGKRTGWADYQKATRKYNWDKAMAESLKRDIQFIMRDL